jgi:hypothetical protein
MIAGLQQSPQHRRQPVLITRWALIEATIASPRTAGIPIQRLVQHRRCLTVAQASEAAIDGLDQQSVTRFDRLQGCVGAATATIELLRDTPNWNIPFWQATAIIFIGNDATFVDGHDTPCSGSKAPFSTTCRSNFVPASSIATIDTPGRSVLPQHSRHTPTMLALPAPMPLVAGVENSSAPTSSRDQNGALHVRHLRVGVAGSTLSHQSLVRRSNGALCSGSPISNSHVISP